MPKKAIKVTVADNHYLSRVGLSSLFQSTPGYQLLASVNEPVALFESLIKNTPDVLVIDHFSGDFNLEHLAEVKTNCPRLHILVITNPQNKKNVLAAFNKGACSYLLKECDNEEIIEAMEATVTGKQFMCSKVMNVMDSGADEGAFFNTKGVSCKGLNISTREMEIIKLVAEGLSNKEIADKLFLSAHTVTTHRKNIMAKLNVNNTAGLVMFAVRENLLDSNHYLFSGTSNN